MIIIGIVLIIVLLEIGNELTGIRKAIQELAETKKREGIKTEL